MTLQKFYKDHLALVVDLRSTEDNFAHGAGKKTVNTQSGILMEITKRATTADVVCQIFVVSDALLNMINGGLQSVQY